MVDRDRVRELNDSFRATGEGGMVVATQGITNMGGAFRQSIIEAVRNYEDFDADSDPYGEHDFGVIDVEDERVFWKIDYYDTTMTCASPDPADPEQTVRVLTIMFADEY